MAEVCSSITRKSNKCTNHAKHHTQDGRAYCGVHYKKAVAEEKARLENISKIERISMDATHGEHSLDQCRADIKFLLFKIEEFEESLLEAYRCDHCGR